MLREPEKARTILVAVDCSKPAEAALDAAISIAKTHQDRVLIVNISNALIAPISYPQNPPAIIDPRPLPAAVPEAAIAEIEPCLKLYERRAIEAGIKSVESKLVPAIGTIGEGIVAEADKNGVSLIIVGSRGLTGIKRVLLGSVADYVVKNAHCDVYVARPPAD